MWGMRNTDKLIEQNNLLKLKVAMYEAKDPIREFQRNCENRVKYATEKMNEYKSALLNSHSEVKGLQGELSELKKELVKAEKSRAAMERVYVRTNRMCSHWQHKHAEEAEKNRILKQEKDYLEAENKALKKSHKTEMLAMQKDFAAKEAALKEEICKLKAQLDRDGTTSGIPTSKTPINKDKRISNVNSREKSGKAKGGQPGHVKASMQEFAAEEATAVEEHTLDCCPHCGGELELTGNRTSKQEVDYKVVVTKVVHEYPECQCKECGHTFRAPISDSLKEKCQYGPKLQALLLATLALGFVSVERTREIAAGIMEQQIKPSVGYVGKLQKKAARKLGDFVEEVKQYCLEQKVLHWDDTVVYMNTKRGCFRFYGNESCALYFAHAAKDGKGIEEDGILPNLSKDTYLMHDHLLINYRKEYLFQNIECVQHLQRDMQKVFNDSGHEWAKRLKELVSSTIHKRKEHLKQGVNAFSDKETNEFEEQFELCVVEGLQKNAESKGKHYFDEERLLLRRLREYKENYFAWVRNFELPTTNNVAESGLRMTKTKMKVSGQFLNEETASEFAKIRTYTETCKRNGVDEFEALYRLMSGNPYTLAEIIETGK